MKYNEQEPVEATDSRKHKALRYWNYINMLNMLKEYEMNK